MSDMVLLASKDGSKVATVACPKCGRISRQILMDEYKSSSITAFRSSHTCPVCGAMFVALSSAESAQYSGSYARYTSQGEQTYNAGMKTAYIAKNRNTQGQNAIGSTGRATQQSNIAPEKIMICNVTFPGSERSYAYISDDLTIKVKDRAVVPVGSDNSEKTGIVISTAFYARSEVPYPIEKTKTIIRKESPDDMRQSSRIDAPAAVSSAPDSKEISSDKLSSNNKQQAQSATTDRLVEDAIAIPKVASVILSILVYTFFSRMFDLMLPPAMNHSTAVA